MKSLFHRIAYFVVLMAMALLMCERFVPHHHCGEISLYGDITVTAIHFGYDGCEECSHSHCSHGHSHSEEKCCDESQLLFRHADGDNLSFKKVVYPSNICFVLPEQQMSVVNHSSGTPSCFSQLKIPDIGAPYAALRAPPTA